MIFSLRNALKSLKFYLLLVWIGFFLLHKNSYSSWDFFTYDELSAFTLEEKATLYGAFDALNALNTGNKLLLEIARLLKDRDKKLCIKKGTQTYFNSNTHTICLSGLNATMVGCLGEKTDIIHDDKNIFVIEVGQALNPFFITLGHELIHVLHFLEDEKRFRRDLRSFTGTLWPPISMNEIRFDRIWSNDEELRTVISTQNDLIEALNSGLPIFSEVQLRYEAGFAPRYAYQKSDQHFYEHPEIIEHIFDYFKNRLSDLQREGWLFKADTAAEHRYSFFNQQ